MEINKEQRVHWECQAPWDFSALLERQAPEQMDQRGHRMLLCPGTRNNESPCVNAGGGQLAELTSRKKACLFFFFFSFLRIVSGLFLFIKEHV